MKKCFHPDILIYFLIWMTLSATAVSGADEREDVLTWPACIKEAAEQNPDLKAAGAQVEQAEEEKNKTRSNLLPQISGSMSYQGSKSSGEGKSDSYSYGISGSQLIFDGLKSWYSLDQSEQSLISARLDYDLTSAEIRLNLRTAFVDLLYAQELVRITEDIAGRRRQQAALVELRYQAGREHRGSLLTAQANLAQAEFDIVQARRDVDVTQKQLQKELGRVKIAACRAEGDLELAISPLRKPDLKALAEQHPSVLKMAAQKESARLEVKSAGSDFFPEISGTASIRRSDSDWPAEGESWSVGVSLSLPIFEGGSRVSEVYRAGAALKEAEENERSERDSVLLSFEEAWRNLQDAHDNIGIQRQFLEADEERAKIATAQYSTGTMSFDNWIIIEDNLVKSQKSYISARASALKTEARWIYARGGTLGFLPVDE